MKKIMVGKSPQQEETYLKVTALGRLGTARLKILLVRMQVGLRLQMFNSWKL